MNSSASKLKNSIHQNHPLASYTSWKIGGPAEYFYQPIDLEDLAQLLQNRKDDPITILGAATNVLIRDQGIKGLVIYLRDTLNDLQVLDNNILHAGAGVSLFSLGKKSADLGMVDATFMAGIPGTVGGALRMNAGAYGDSIWNHVENVTTINRQGKIKLRPRDEFVASYRQIEGLDDSEWFVSADLFFTQDDIETAKQQMQSYLQKRAESQPLNLPNCGSVFRNPENDYAARLIESCGLKGKRIGDAQISEKHANFIINCGKATAADIETLIQEIIETVEKKTRTKLIPEIHILGEK